MESAPATRLLFFGRSGSPRPGTTIPGRKRLDTMKIKTQFGKLSSKFCAVILFLALQIGINHGAAQSTTPDSIVQIAAEAQGLQRLASDQLPPFGTFWEVL